MLDQEKIRELWDAALAANPGQPDLAAELFDQVLLPQAEAEAKAAELAAESGDFEAEGPELNVAEMAPPLQAKVLAENLAKLSPKDRSFAESLLRQLKTKGKLSQKQWPWVTKLAERALNPAAKPAAKTQELGDVSGISALFAKAKAKNPALNIVTAAGEPIRLKRAGPNSKYAGKILVTDGAPFGQNKWYGTIDAAGVWTKGFKATDEVAAALCALAADPEGFAKACAKLTGRCIFCNRALYGEKEISQKLGYGPECAKNFGLKWG